MPLLSNREVLRLKISTIPSDIIKNIIKNRGGSINKVPEMIKYLMNKQISHLQQ